MVQVPPYTVVDLETENNEYYGMVASPFCPDNYIIEAGWKNNNSPVESKRFKHREEEERSGWFQYAFDNGKEDSDCHIMVAHNATYELHWFMSSHMEALLAFFNNGGKIWCTQYAEYLLSQQQDLYPDLNTTAPKYGGTPKVDEVKLLWEKGVLTSQIDPDLLHEYLCSDHGDVINTEKIFLGQWQEAQDRGMLEMIQIRMDALLFNAFCTYFGMHIDVHTAEKNLKVQTERANNLREKIQEHLPKDLPFEFKFSSDYHMSAWIFGGPIKYNKLVPYDPPKYVKGDFYKIDGEYVPVQPDMDLSRAERYRAGKNKGMPKIFREDTDVEKLKWGEDQYRFTGLIDLEKADPSIREAFCGKRAEFQGKRTLHDGTPVYSTSSEALSTIKNYVPVVAELLELAQIEKDNGTYYRKIDYNPDGSIKKVSGMLQYVLPDGIIHHQLNNCSTVTGRLSSSRPNLQNLPRDGTSRVKEMFDSRFQKGRVIEVDYTALEVVTLAATSGDKALIKNLNEGTDMHCYRLAFWEGLPYEEVYKHCHDEEDPEHKAWKAKRTAIKSKSFAAQYGASANGIAYATGCTSEEAKRFLDNEDKLFPESRAFKKLVREMVEATGRLPESVERELDPATGAFRVYRRGYYKSPSGTEYSFRQRPQWKSEEQYEVLDYKDTEISNYPIQGEGAFIVQSACARIIRKLIACRFNNFMVLPINQVHDALYFDVMTEDLAKRVGKWCAEEMAYTPTWITKILPAYKEWNYDTVPFPAVPEYGKNLYNKQGIE